MIYYITIYIILLLPLYFDKGQLKKRNIVIYYIILPLFLCFGYMIGSDWRSYELFYENINSINDITLLGREPGYFILGYFLKLIGFDFWAFSITIKLIGYYIFLEFYKKHSEKNVYGILFFFVYFALFL
jgi:hypothetical protein